MSNTSFQNAMVVSIMGKEYHVKCPPSKVEELRDSAAYLSKKMEEIRDGGKTVGLDRIAVTAALNVCHELHMTQRQNHTYISHINGRISNIQNKIEQALDD